MHDDDTGAKASTQESGHTLGPWVVERDLFGAASWHWGNIASTYSEANDGFVVAKLYGPDAEANAALIAAAPDLLKALHACMIYTNMFKGGDEVMQLAVDEAKAAIAKARGQS